MGTISISMVNNLFWLGRYTERVFTTLIAFTDGYDRMIEDPQYYKEFLAEFGLYDNYENNTDFVKQYLYNKDIDYSLISALTKALDNGILLREEITSETLSYLQLTMDTFLSGQNYQSPLYPLVPVKDYLYAFWGSIDDCVPNPITRDLIRIGRYIERLELYARLDYPTDNLQTEFARLERRIHRLSINNTIISQFFFDKLSDLLNGELTYDKKEVINCLANLLQEQ